MARYYSDMVNRRTCVYRCYDATGVLLYVGISMHLDARLAKHRGRGWWPDVAEITVQWFDGREPAKAAERKAIAEEGPLHNIARPLSMPTIREVP